MTLSKAKETRYKKILNNLLDIKGRDQALFTSVHSTVSFDVNTKFGENTALKLLTNKSFSFTLKEDDIKELLAEIKKETDYQRIIAAYEKYKIRLFNTKKLALENPKTFAETKKLLINDLKERIQKKNNRWKIFISRGREINDQKNIWPIHIATMFISVKTDRKVVYAPLLIKEVQLYSSPTELRISSDSPWLLNEKLLFILNNNNFNLEENFDFEKYNALGIAEELKQQYNLDISNVRLYDEFTNKHNTDIKNTSIKVHSGVVLGLFEPSGGHLRKTMIEILENDELDEIIDPNIIKTVYEKNIDEYIKETDKNILRVQKTNFSQDKAIISGLLQDTIIWGPPGTGKSQTISNLIANIFNEQKTAVVMSQKKAALDVLRNRLGKISKFALFILNDKKMNKKAFYKPLQKFTELIETTQEEIHKEDTKLMSQKEIDAISLVENLKKNKQYLPSLELIKILTDGDKHNDFTYFLHLVKLLDPNIEYPSVLDMKNLKQQLIDLNKIQKHGFIFKTYPRTLRQTVKGLKSLFAVNCNVAWHELNWKQFGLVLRKANIDILEELKNVPEDLVRPKGWISDEEYLENKLTVRILNKIKSWYNKETEDKESIKLYKRFSNAVRAGRRLPFNFINDHVQMINFLFPIIITTPHTTFVGWRKNSFDYAILDESSQIFLEVGLPVLYLANTKIIAGDSEQMQPSRWFASRDDEYIDHNEEDVVENAESLLDYAYDKGVFQILLDKNYRAKKAELMSFSAKQFYESKLDVVDTLTTSNAGIETINVNGKWEKRTNLIEAKKVIEILLENLKKYEKIIVLTFNSNQQQLIFEMIINDFPKIEAAIEEEQVLLRNIENIQGDEADLVIASVAYDKDSRMGGNYVTRAGGSNALNVAISRAKEKMIVVKSISHKNMKQAKGDDYRIFKEWLAFLDFNEIERKKYSSIELAPIKVSYGESESGFEEEVVETIKGNLFPSNLTLIQQYEVGSKRIDLAFIDKTTNEYILGVEVDGYKYHKGQGYKKYLEDYDRQAFLEDKGYDIYRITEINWLLSKEREIKQIKELLKTI